MPDFKDLPYGASADELRNGTSPANQVQPRPEYRPVRRHHSHLQAMSGGLVPDPEPRPESVRSKTRIDPRRLINKGEPQRKLLARKLKQQLRALMKRLFRQHKKRKGQGQRRKPEKHRAHSQKKSGGASPSQAQNKKGEPSTSETSGPSKKRPRSQRGAKRAQQQEGDGPSARRAPPESGSSADTRRRRGSRGGRKKSPQRNKSKASATDKNA